MISSAAIRKGDKIWTGTRHCEIISKMIADGVKPPVGGEQGFVDDMGRFLDRHTAGEHAIACGQIERMRWPGMGLDSVEIVPRGKEAHADHN